MMFDPVFRLISQTSPNATVTYTYDNANRLTQVTQGSSNTDFAYDNAGRRTSMTLPNGITVNYGYDTDSRISSISYQTGLANVIGTLSYVYDGAGRRMQVGGTLSRTNLPAMVSSASYDMANELTSWNGTSISYDGRVARPLMSPASLTAGYETGTVRAEPNGGVQLAGVFTSRLLHKYQQAKLR